MLSLKEIRLEMGFSHKDMADELGLSCRGVYQGYEEGRRTVPPAVLEKAQVSLQKVRAFMACAPARIEERINKQYPYGFLSEVESE